MMGNRYAHAYGVPGRTGDAVTAPAMWGTARAETKKVETNKPETNKAARKRSIVGVGSAAIQIAQHAAGDQIQFRQAAMRGPQISTLFSRDIC
jgi:hypothetical protein